MNTTTCSQLIFNKGSKKIQRERIVSSINDVGKIGKKHAKE